MQRLLCTQRGWGTGPLGRRVEGEHVHFGRLRPLTLSVGALTPLLRPLGLRHRAGPAVHAALSSQPWRVLVAEELLVAESLAGSAGGAVESGGCWGLGPAGGETQAALHVASCKLRISPRLLCFWGTP